MTKAEAGYAFHVSFHWKARPEAPASFWCFEYSELPERISFEKGWFPQPFFKKRELMVRAEEFTPASLDKALQDVNIAKRQAPLWLSKPTSAIWAAAISEPQKPIKAIYRELLLSLNI